MRVYKANVGPRICAGTADLLSPWIYLDISEHETQECETNLKCYNVVSPDKNLNSSRERFFLNLFLNQWNRQRNGANY